VKGSSIGSSNIPITGSTLTLSATNITALTLPYGTSNYIHNLQIGSSNPGSDNASAALFISVPSSTSNIPFAIVNSSGKGVFNVDRNGNVTAANYGAVNGSTGSFSGDISTNNHIVWSADQLNGCRQVLSSCTFIPTEGGDATVTVTPPSNTTPISYWITVYTDSACTNVAISNGVFLANVPYTTEAIVVNNSIIKQYVILHSVWCPN